MVLDHILPSPFDHKGSREAADVDEDQEDRERHAAFPARTLRPWGWGDDGG